ncbi:Spherulation-specific family 4-domain-containing protein [Mycena sanguinolenta]|nr:Spherulation-specific family 4-domain-containing protein [Mycena sanguinolenta]
MTRERPLGSACFSSLRLLNALILLPLYIYPGTDCAAWSPVSDAISANSNTQWYIVVNPDNGPGPTDELYETCVSELPASANQITMGYVDTKGDVLGDIDTYAGWPTSSRPRGIFFDDIVPTTSRLSTYQSYISYARSQGFTFIGLDAGETVEDSAYFSIADLINTYEDSYSSFDPDSLSGTMSQQSVILVKSPTTGTYSAVISQLANLGVGAVYISSVSDSSQALPAQLSEFANEIASVGGDATSSGPLTAASSSSSTAGSAPASSKSPSFSQSLSLGGASLQTSSAQSPGPSTLSGEPKQWPPSIKDLP